MVTNVTSLTGNGLKDWLIQRVTAVYFAVYALFLLFFVFFHPQMAFQDWYALFTSTLFKIASVLALLALSMHAWIGIWTVTTDYIKGTCFRLFIQMAVMTWLLAQFVWGLMIVWGY